MYRPVLVTPPTLQPLGVVEVKEHLRVDDTDSDALIAALINAAVSLLDGWTGTLGRCLMPQTWRQDYDIFRRHMRLPLFPVISITSIKYDDLDRTEQTVGGTNYKLLVDDCGAYVRFNNAYPFVGVSNEYPSVRIAYQTGYADASSVPAAIKQGMLLLIAHWYENREAVNVGNLTTALPFAVEALLAPFRRVSV